ncbi:MAG: DNA-processing protein DprA [Clostridiales bacterium]|nr:DNA-processing protein DprA [Clostridiales bacterium]
MNNTIQSVKFGDQDYPERLKHIKDPPKELFYRGDISLASELSIAIVGTRKATGYGIWAATNIAEKLAAHGVIVTSGMAFGIDTCGHRGALKGGGKTIAVLGSGIDICTPASNKNLMNTIARDGLVISEYPPGTPAAKYTFPRRNRIISGISAATVVVEAGLSSGALITAELAAEQGKDVYAVPGNIDSIYSIGTNKLIKEGALPLVTCDDLLDDLGIKRNPAVYLPEGLGKTEKEMLQHIGMQSEVTVDYLYRMTGKPPSEINGIITILEIKGMVYTHMGKIFIAK